MIDRYPVLPLFAVALRELYGIVIGQLPGRGPACRRSVHARGDLEADGTALGAAYTVYSEWLNTGVRMAWAYSELMPVVPGIGTGLSPLLQWLVLPPLGLWLCGRWSAPRVDYTKP